MATTIILKSGESFVFDLASSNPFLVFPWLQKLAAEHVRPENLFDLSRGDPGYGFSPSVRSKRLYGLIVHLESRLNSLSRRFLNDPLQEGALLSDIEQIITESYAPDLAKTLLADWNEFLKKIQDMGTHSGIPAKPWNVLWHLFGNSNCVGGNYHNPWGEPLTRAVLAFWHSRVLGKSISYQDLIVTHGASHAIGAVYEALGEEGVGYLKRGSKVLLFSPCYAPYLHLNQSRGLETIMIRWDPFTGLVNEEDLHEAEKQDIRLIVLIDPHNPTGFSLGEKELDLLAHLAEKANALIVTDEVYSSFLCGKKTLLHNPLAAKRMIRIDSLSKIERSTGLRFGDILLLEEANRFLSDTLLKPFLRSGDTLRQLLFRAKSPGGGQAGVFQHTTTMPGPCQMLGMAHILLADEERKIFIATLQENMKVFYETLKCAYRGNIYYGLLDLQLLKGSPITNKSPEECFVELARQGVVLMPSHLFFSERDRAEQDRRYTFRVSLANLSTKDCKKAAEIILEYAKGDR